MSEKKLWIIAGANGAGKTSSLNITEINNTTHLVSRNNKPMFFVNTDIIAKKKFPDVNPKDYSNSEKIKAARSAIQVRNRLLKQGKSFAIETTLSGKSEIKLINLAKKEGYEINIFYIGLNINSKNINRVKNRAKQGGHYISPEEITRRYERSIENLNSNWSIVDNLYLFDNSKQNKELIAKVVNNKITYLSTPPQWAKKVHSSLKEEKDKHFFLENPKIGIYDVPYLDNFEAHKSGLYFNSFLKKYTESEVSQVTTEQETKWNQRKNINYDFFEKKINPALNNYLEEKGFRRIGALDPTEKYNLQKEETYQNIISSGKNLEQITELLMNTRDAQLVLNPTSKNTTAYIINDDSQLIETWNYRKKELKNKQSSEAYNNRIKINSKQLEEYDLTAEKAQIIYDHLQPVKPFFGYLKNKEITPDKDIKYIDFKAKEYFKERLDWNTAYNQMVIPIRNWDKQLRSLQIINEKGDWKGFLANGEIKGNFSTFGKEDPRKSSRVIITEGYATGVSIHQSTGIPVVIAFQSNNLLPVATQFREQNPSQTIYIGADNDYKSFIKKDIPQNVGLQSAIITAKAVDAKVIYPPLLNKKDKEAALQGWDWNDYAVKHSKQMARKEILSQIGNTSEVTTPICSINYENNRVITLQKNEQEQTMILTKEGDLYLHENKEMASKVSHAIAPNQEDKFLDSFRKLGFSVDVKPFLKKQKETSLKGESKLLNKSNTNKILSNNEIREEDKKNNSFKLDKFSPKLQEFYRFVMTSAENKGFSSNQIVVLEERLELAVKQYQKKELKEKSYDKEK